MVEVKSISEIIESAVPAYKGKGPNSSHKIVYDSPSETLEPIYFFILDLMNDLGLSPEKLIDTFASSPGSGNFSEFGQKATIMQQQAQKLMGDVNTVLRSVLNIIHDLKDFKIRLQQYDLLKSESTKESALLGLKQVWLDKVDMTKGNSSIKAMSFGQAGFQTLLDAFLFVKNSKDVSKLDLNDRVKRVLLPRIQEFELWLTQSEDALRKRYELERTYLKSQVNNLKLYSRWAKPYFLAAQQLEMKETGSKEPALVKAFNTIILELTLFGKRKINIEDAALQGRLPANFNKIRDKRDYYGCVLVDLKFRGIPQKVGQHYVLGGKAEMSFRGYALNDEELAKFEAELKKSDIEDVLGLIRGVTDESLKQLQSDIDSFLEEKTPEEKEKEKPKDTSNPFLALFGFYEKSSKTEKKPVEAKKEVKDVRPDNWIEKTYLRPLAVEGCTEIAFTLFDIYKKAHGMQSFT